MREEPKIQLNLVIRNPNSNTTIGEEDENMQKWSEKTKSRNNYLLGMIDDAWRISHWCVIGTASADPILVSHLSLCVLVLSKEEETFFVGTVRVFLFISNLFLFLFYLFVFVSLSFLIYPKDSEHLWSEPNQCVTGEKRECRVRMALSSQHNRTVEIKVNFINYRPERSRPINNL